MYSYARIHCLQVDTHNAACIRHVEQSLLVSCLQRQCLSSSIYLLSAAPVFVIQHLFDEAQLTVDNVLPAVQKQQWGYIQRVGQDMRTTLANVSYVTC